MTPYRLPSKSVIEADANHYRKEIHDRKEDRGLAQQLFSELLEPIKQYREKADLVIIPDGSLHLLPFSALADSSAYVLKTHTVDVAPSSTVYEMLERRSESREAVDMPYIGVAAWTQPADTRNPILRAINGPQRSQLIPLPDSRKEVETIAEDLPHPSTILLGADATESRFKQVSMDSTEVVHLALHGYADLDYPDRSALVFAPEQSSGTEDGLLQVRENPRTSSEDEIDYPLSLQYWSWAGRRGWSCKSRECLHRGRCGFRCIDALGVGGPHYRTSDDAVLRKTRQSRKKGGRTPRSSIGAAGKGGCSPYYWASFQVVGDPNGTL